MTAEPQPTKKTLSRNSLLSYLTTTDHKQIGIVYVILAFSFFLIGGLLAMGIRAELAQPGLDFVGKDTYNQLFTMHGTIMVFLFAMPVFTGFANIVVPLQIGAPDMAFPRLNAMSLWFFAGGGILLMSGYLTADGPANFGWTGYAPLSSHYTPGPGGDLWVLGLLVSGVGTLLTAVNFITTVICLRAPGMTMFRMPIFTWNILVTSFLILLAFPVLTVALALLYLDREAGTTFFDASAGGAPILWQHLFWFFGHPEVYILALPFFGMVSEILPVFARKPLFGYKAFVFATLAIAAYSITTWAHHMFSTGGVMLTYFSATTLIIAVPTGVKVFGWIATIWRGQLSFKTPMLFSIGFLVVFLIGGLTGPMLALAALDFHLTDTYFVVAHFHYVMVGAAVFATFGAFYFWWPKATGHMLNEKIGKLHFFFLFIGFNLTFFPQHILGLRGMPRRYADYLPDQGFNFIKMLSSSGAAITFIGMMFFVVNLYVSRKQNVPAGDDPWGGNTLEWATTSPAPPHNFDSLPPIRSERPVFDARHPELVHVHRKG